MRKLLLMIAFAASMAVSAQNYPGEKVELIDGKELKVMHTDSNMKHGYQGFYTDEKLKKTYKGKLGFTHYDAVIGKTFKVLSYTPYTNNIGQKNYILKVENADIGLLYFDYDTKYSHTFPFEVVGGLTYPEGYFCGKAVEKESASKDRKYEFPYQNGVQLSYYSDDTFQYMILIVNTPIGSAVPATVLEGVTLTFDNGETIKKPELILSIGTDGSKGVVASAVFGLLGSENQKEIDLLQNHKLIKIKLDKYERDFKEGFTLQEYAKCATK